MKHKNKLLMLKGFPASGKTTYAKALMEKEPNQYVRVCKEDLRDMMFFGDKKNCVPGSLTYWQGKNAKFGKIVCASIIKLAISQGYDVIADGSNLTKKHEHFLRDIARNRAKFEVVKLNTPFEECLRRNAGRKNPLPVERMYALRSAILHS